MGLVGRSSPRGGQGRCSSPRGGRLWCCSSPGGGRRRCTVPRGCYAAAPLSSEEEEEEGFLCPTRPGGHSGACSWPAVPEPPLLLALPAPPKRLALPAFLKLLTPPALPKLLAPPALLQAPCYKIVLQFLNNCFLLYFKM